MALADAVDMATAQRLADAGLLSLDAAGLRLTAAGWPLVNAVLRDIAR